MKQDQDPLDRLLDDVDCQAKLLTDYWRWWRVNGCMASGQSTDIDIKPKANAKTQDK